MKKILPLVALLCAPGCENKKPVTAPVYAPEKQESVDTESMPYDPRTFDSLLPDAPKSTDIDKCNLPEYFTQIRDYYSDVVEFDMSETSLKTMHDYAAMRTKYAIDRLIVEDVGRGYTMSQDIAGTVIHGVYDSVLEGTRTDAGLSNTTDPDAFEIYMWCMHETPEPHLFTIIHELSHQYVKQKYGVLEIEGERELTSIISEGVAQVISLDLVYPRLVADGLISDEQKKEFEEEKKNALEGLAIYMALLTKDEQGEIVYPTNAPGLLALHRMVGYSQLQKGDHQVEVLPYVEHIVQNPEHYTIEIESLASRFIDLMEEQKKQREDPSYIPNSYLNDPFQVF